jgi:hypothetical protein
MKTTVLFLIGMFFTLGGLLAQAPAEQSVTSKTVNTTPTKVAEKPGPFDNNRTMQPLGGPGKPAFAPRTEALPSNNSTVVQPANGTLPKQDIPR